MSRCDHARAAPALSSVTPCGAVCADAPGAASTPAASATARRRGEGLHNRDVVGDADVRGEGRHHRAVFLEREIRSEEHTSELQSRLHLVCRLLLEKKKKKT